MNSAGLSRTVLVNVSILHSAICARTLEGSETSSSWLRSSVSCWFNESGRFCQHYFGWLGIALHEVFVHLGEAVSFGFPIRVDEIAREKNVDPATIEIWFADEARIGLKNKITRRWAWRGARPSAPKDQRTASPNIFGAICPKDGKGAALVMRRCDTEAMNLHLVEIAVTVKGAWTGPAAIELFEHARCDVARLPVREVVSASHYLTDLTLGLGEVVFDYLKTA